MVDDSINPNVRNQMPHLSRSPYDTLKINTEIKKILNYL